MGIDSRPPLEQVRHVSNKLFRVDAPFEFLSVSGLMVVLAP